FEVAHFADEDHIGVLAQGSAKRGRESVRVGVDLALIDQTTFVVVEKLDRILDGKNVFVTIAIDLVDHGRERGRLSGSGWTGNENQAARLIAEVFDNRGQTEFFEGFDFVGNGAKDGAHRAPLVEQVGTKARQAFD